MAPVAILAQAILAQNGFSALSCLLVRALIAMASSRRITIRHGHLVLHIDRADLPDVLPVLDRRAFDGDSAIAALAAASARLVSCGSRPISWQDSQSPRRGFLLPSRHG